MKINNTLDTLTPARAVAPTEDTLVCDFRHAYLHFELDFTKQPPVTVTVEQPFTLNHVRIPVECRCVINGVAYVLGAACKTESVNVTQDVWTLPNADFNPVFSEEHFMIIKAWDHRERQVPHGMTEGYQPRRQSGLVSQALPHHRIDTPTVHARRLHDADEAWEAVMNNLPLISRTCYQTEDGLDVVLEYPVKTVNVSNRDAFCQPDTGPVLVPMPNLNARTTIERLHLAYVAHCGKSWAEFIVNVPTPIADGLSVDHYSKVVRVDAVSVLFALD